MNIVRHAGTKHIFISAAIGMAAAVVALGLAASLSRGQEIPPAAKLPPGKSQPAVTSSGSSNAPKAMIQRAIADLGSADFATRERASQALWKAGVEAEPALEKAIRETDDFEVVYRARRILDSFQVGIYVDTPVEIVALIGQFRIGNLNMKGEAARRLKEKGKTELLRRLIAKESNPLVRDQLSQFLAESGSTGGRVALGGCPPRAPTDPYVDTLDHTVPRDMESLLDVRVDDSRRRKPIAL